MRTASLNNRESFIYPFIDSIPFPSGMIRNIKIALKTDNNTPFVSSIIKVGDSFSIQLSNSQKVLGQFIYEGDNFINLNNQNIYGFIQLGYCPEEEMNYRGRFQIHRSCYTQPVYLEGIEELNINNKNVQCPNILKLKCKGECTLQVAGTDVRLKRTQNPSYSFFQKANDQYNYVLTINGQQCQQLIIKSDAYKIIQVNKATERPEKTYVIYINTSDGFPTCQRQRRQDEHI